LFRHNGEALPLWPSNINPAGPQRSRSRGNGDCSNRTNAIRGRLTAPAGAMAKDRKPPEELSAFANQGMSKHARRWTPIFDYLKKAISSTPSGGTEFGEKLKSYAEANLATTHEFVRQLSNVRDFNGMVRIQTEFMQSLLNAMGEQTKELTETYAKTAADIATKPFAGMSS
jgi:hypothetical protein